MKKRFFSILLCICMVMALVPATVFADELTPTITINGPDVVCAPQDYEFTVTASEGVTLETKFGFDTGLSGSDQDLILENGVLSGVVPAKWYGSNPGSFTLTVHGTYKTAEGTKTIDKTKTVSSYAGHSFNDGVCQRCGAKQQYIVTYDLGADSGLMVDVKTHGEDLTLHGEFFTREGYVQTGWIDANNSEYALGGIYSTDADVTLYPVWDTKVTITVPFTTTVNLGGNVAPGETTFDLEFVNFDGSLMGVGDEGSFENIDVTASVTTNGVGSYQGTMTITGPSKEMHALLKEGARVKQTDDGEAYWTYDDTVWGLFMNEETSGGNDDIVAMAVSEGADADAASKYYPVVYSTTYENGSYEINMDAGPVETMTFTNTYTKSAAASTDSNSNNGKAKSPQTGDNSNLTLWFALLAVSAAGVIGTGMYSRRRRSSQAK